MLKLTGALTLFVGCLIFPLVGRAKPKKGTGAPMTLVTYAPGGHELVPDGRDGGVGVDLSLVGVGTETAGQRKAREALERAEAAKRRMLASQPGHNGEPYFYWAGKPIYSREEGMEIMRLVYEERKRINGKCRGTNWVRMLSDRWGGKYMVEPDWNRSTNFDGNAPFDDPKRDRTFVEWVRAGGETHLKYALIGERRGYTDATWLGRGKAGVGQFIDWLNDPDALAVRKTIADIGSVAALAFGQPAIASAVAQLGDEIEKPDVLKPGEGKPSWVSDLTGLAGAASDVSDLAGGMGGDDGA